jgi:hypothetical protein
MLQAAQTTNAQTITVNDAQVVEPTSGVASMAFTVALSAPAASEVTVHYSTADQTATAGSDYTAIGDTILVFAPGEVIKIVSVDVLADSDISEASETLALNLSLPSGAVIDNGQGVGTIRPFGKLKVHAPLIISELRTSGPGGSQDDYVELYNNSDTPTTVEATDGSPGYGLFKKGATCNSTPILVATVPNGTIVPARGYYLLVGAQYSLNAYATGDLTLTGDLEDGAGLALFITTNIAGLSTVSRLDAVGFGSNVGNNCQLLQKGGTLPTLGNSPLEYAFYRDLCGKGGSVSVPGRCPSLGLPADTDNNAADYLFGDTTGTFTVAGQRIGTPGPQNLAAPIVRNVEIPESLVDPALPVHLPPNRFRDPTPDPANNATFGTMTITRIFTNNTGLPVSSLRFRIIDVTSAPVFGGLADLRAINSSDLTVTVTGGGMVLLRGTTLETAVPQPEGGTMNSSLRAGSVTLASPLAP